jgi:2-dehydro-3-deoxyphosphooctonate aldolase (KDO 8-P synthase)
METHPRPQEALSDGPNAWPLGQMQELLATLQRIDTTIKSAQLPEAELLEA